MKIAIISDIHDNITNLDNFLKFASKESVEAVICCGDVTNLDTLSYLLDNFTESVYLVPGNCCLFDKNKLPENNNLYYFEKIGQAELDGKKIAFCHEPEFIENIANGGKLDVIFFGHTHKPDLKIINNIPAINPGTLAGIFYPACFAVWNTEEPEPKLKLLSELD